MLAKFSAIAEVSRINTIVGQGRLCSTERRAFLSRPFEQQAALIGERAKLQLAKVDDIISRTFTGAVPRGIPDASRLWGKMIDSRVQDSEAARITAVCSELQGESENIADLFGGCYRFWVDNFYSCDADGNENLQSALSSPATRFTSAQMHMIDELSGMEYLGSNLRGYARGYAKFLSGLANGK